MPGLPDSIAYPRSKATYLIFRLNRSSTSAGAVGGNSVSHRESAAGRSSIEDPTGDMLLNCPPGAADLGGLSSGCVPLVPDPIVVRGAGNITV